MSTDNLYLDFGKNAKVKHNPYRTRHVMDGDVLVGTVEYDYPGWVATVEETGETQWFHRKDAADTWVRDQRSELTHSNMMEQALSVRYESGLSGEAWA